MKTELFQKLAYVLHGIIYLPHYTEKGRYVSPGYGLSHFDLYNENDLKLAGAKPQILMLWSRSW